MKLFFFRKLLLDIQFRSKSVNNGILTSSRDVKNLVNKFSFDMLFDVFYNKHLLSALELVLNELDDNKKCQAF